MLYCPECGSELGPDVDFCSECGEPIEKEPARSEKFQIDDPDQPPGYMEATIPFHLPFKTNKLVMLRRLGGCPGCGEGVDLEFDSVGLFSKFTGQPTGPIYCNRCGTKLEATYGEVTVINGPADIEGEELSFSENAKWAESRRIGEPVHPEERYNHITGDYYWDREAVGGIYWATALIALIVPPLGAFLIALFVGISIKASPPID